MSTVEEKAQSGELLGFLSKPLTAKGKRIRGVDAFGKDMELLCAISDPAFDVLGITNMRLQEKLRQTPWEKNMSGKQLSGRI